MRILICDDDAHLRSVLRTVVTQHGHEIVGEAETAADAYALLARSKPDAAIVDLALRSGSGRDVASDASIRGCRVIVFSAYIDEVDPGSLGVVAVMKPDFPALESALDALASTRADVDQWRAGQADRRATTTAAGRAAPMSPLEEASDFYRALGDAHPGDTVLVLDVGSEQAATTLAVSVRAVMRAHDHLMQRGSQLAVLLVDGLPNAAEAVCARLVRATPHMRWASRHAVVTDDEIPADTYSKLRTP